MEDCISRATKKDMYLRELDIQRLIGEGHDRKFICETLAEKWEVSPRTIESQYYQIIDDLGKTVEDGRAELRSKLMARAEFIFKQALADKKYKTALDASVVQAKLGGLYDTKHVEDNKMPEIITVSERDYSGPRLVGESAENE